AYRTLAAVNQFNGHTREPCSAAQHSVLVSIEIERVAKDCGVTDGQSWALSRLLHDAADAYLCDVPRPLKRLPAFAPNRGAEARLQAVIYHAFGLDAGGEPRML